MCHKSMTHLFFSKSHNRYHLSTYSQNLSFIYNKSIIFAAEIKITNKKIKNKEKNDNGNKKRNSSRKETLWLT